MSDDLEANTLYVRGMDVQDDSVEDVWDDTALNSAYDRAVKMANDVVAKRIAMETNSKVKGDTDLEEGQVNKSKLKKQKKPRAWKPGMPCRAIFEDDGQEYEAFLIRTVGDDEGIVKFLGYDNEQKVSINTLKPTLGNKERMRQLEDAIGERPDDGFESQPEPSPGNVSPVERSTNKKKKSQKNKKKNSTTPVIEHPGHLPNIPMPDMDMFRNMNSSLPMPMPPPPPLSQLNSMSRTNTEEQAISDMLLSWYMTGYYTGLYQGMKRQNQNGKRH